MDPGFDSDAERPPFTRGKPPGRSRPFRRSYPLEILDEHEARRAGLFTGDAGLDDGARSAALEILVEIEIVRIGFEPPSHCRHLAMDMVSRDPARIVMRM